MEFNIELMNIYKKLYTEFGPQHWWPGDFQLEICIGAILTQNTNWKNVELAIKNIKHAKKMSMKKLNEITIEELAFLIRPSGYFNAKAMTIKSFIKTAQIKSGLSLNKFLNQPLNELRKELLSIKGIGPETADSIILYAAQKPIFLVDAYTRRLVERHFGFSHNAKYHQIQKFFQENLPKDTQLFNEYHALIVKLGKHHCKTKPQCFDCPLI